MKKRKVALGLVVAGAVLGVFLSGRFPGFPGSATTARSLEKAGSKPEAGAVAKAPNAQAASAATAPEAAPAPTPKKPSAPPPKKLLVRVDEYNYQVTDAAEIAWREANLRDILLLAKRTTGDEDGLRVRILRRRSARYTAWARLYAELESAGLPSDSISMPKELVD